MHRIANVGGATAGMEGGKVALGHEGTQEPECRWVGIGAIDKLGLRFCLGAARANCVRFNFA
jgi:hypothetical protein